jgi:hypothetical protein
VAIQLSWQKENNPSAWGASLKIFYHNDAYDQTNPCTAAYCPACFVSKKEMKDKEAAKACGMA